jgi:hypothetical protein
MDNYCESVQYFYNNPGITLSPRQTHVQPSVQIESSNPRFTSDISEVNVSADQKKTETLTKYQQIQHSNVQDEKEKKVKLGRVSYTDVLNAMIKNTNNKNLESGFTNLKLDEFIKRLKQPGQAILQNNYNDYILFKDNVLIAPAKIQSDARTSSKTFQSDFAQPDVPNMYIRDVHGKRICMDFTRDEDDINLLSEAKRSEIHSFKNASMPYHQNEQKVSLNHNKSNSVLIDFQHSSFSRAEFPPLTKHPMVEKQPMYYHQQINKHNEQHPLYPHQPYNLFQQDNVHTQIFNKPKFM